MYEYALGKTEGIFQIVRHRGGVMPHQKPRWFPVAPSKKFRLPPTRSHTSVRGRHVA